MRRAGGYTTAGSGKSMARALFAVIVFGVMGGFLISMWKGKEATAAWASIITALTVPLGGSWIWGKIRGGSGASQPTKGQGTPGEGGQP